MRASLFLQCITNHFWFVCFVRVFVFLHFRGGLFPCGFVGVVVSVLGRSVDALVPGADEGRGRPR